jgi:hypothetical protein
MEVTVFGERKPVFWKKFTAFRGKLCPYLQGSISYK